MPQEPIGDLQVEIGWISSQPINCNAQAYGFTHNVFSAMPTTSGIKGPLDRDSHEDTPGEAVHNMDMATSLDFTRPLSERVIQRLIIVASFIDRHHQTAATTSLDSVAEHTAEGALRHTRSIKLHTRQEMR